MCVKWILTRAARASLGLAASVVLVAACGAIGTDSDKNVRAWCKQLEKYPAVFNALSAPVPPGTASRVPVDADSPEAMEQTSRFIAGNTEYLRNLVNGAPVSMRADMTRLIQIGSYNHRTDAAKNEETDRLQAALDRAVLDACGRSIKFRPPNAFTSFRP